LRRIFAGLKTFHFTFSSGIPSLRKTSMKPGVVAFGADEERKMVVDKGKGKAPSWGGVGAMAMGDGALTCHRTPDMDFI
jgi:hypothetical protein